MNKRVFETAHGFEYHVGQNRWHVPPLKVAPFDWICLEPVFEETTLDASNALVRILTSLEIPSYGDIRIIGKDIKMLSYRQKLKLRQKIGFVQSTGGLLSNRTLFQNIEYPLLIHSGLASKEMATRIDHYLDNFGLMPFKNYRPHEIDGRARWKACVARALVTKPRWLVMEGIGDWNYTNGQGLVWNYLKTQLRSEITLAVCLAQHHYHFIGWFKENDGRVIKYHTISDGDA